MTIYHGGSVERDRYGYVEFVEMQSVPVLFNDRPSYSELIARAREELHCPGHDIDIVVEGVLHLGAPPNNLRRIIPIGSDNQWDNYVRSAMKSQLQCLDVVVRSLINVPTYQPRTDCRVGKNGIANEPVQAVVDAQSALGHDSVTFPHEEIPLTQNHPSKCSMHKFISIVGSSFHSFLSLSTSVWIYNVGNIAENARAPPTFPPEHLEEGFRASNSVEVRAPVLNEEQPYDMNDDEPYDFNDEQPYDIAMAIDSDEDRPVGDLTESDIEMMRRILPGRDLRVHAFRDLTLSDQAVAEGRDDELLDAPEATLSMVIEKGRVFKDLPALKRWLQHYAVIRKRPYKVLHSYAERRYTVVCDKESCQWRVCGRKQKVTGKWKITKVVGPHTCAEHELTRKHRQLTSTLIAKRLMGILKEEPNMKVRTIIRTVKEVYDGFVISYGKAWRAKQRAWKMIYGDWESAYEKLPELLNAIKAVNPGMHYEYLPNPNKTKGGREIFFRAFWCFPQCVEAFKHCRPVFSIDGTFLLGKYRGTLLIAISCDANNMLVPMAFALVEKENKDSWGWFLRLVRIHVVGPGREVGVISDRHQGILNAVSERIEGYAPLHHRWCTRHLAENLLRKDSVKDNFERLQVAARQLEVKFFHEKLEEIKIATNAEGRQWLSGIMKDLDKWTRSHDVGGWRYEFQCSNMAESFNKLLLGIRGMPVNAIVSFTFYKLNEFFIDRHKEALKLQSAGQRWSIKAKQHLETAKERAYTHDVKCFDHDRGIYEVDQRGGTTSDGEVRESRRHVVVLEDFSCTCGAPKQYHFPCSHIVAASSHRNYDFESRIPSEFSVQKLLLTWSPRFVPFRDSGEWPSYDGPRYIADEDDKWDKRGSRKRTRHKMVMDQVSGRTKRGKTTPFLADPEQNECGKCGRFGHNSRTCHWQISQVQIVLVFL